MLFPQENRTSLDSANHAERLYDYLNRSGRPEMGRIRDLLEDWFQRYPGEHQNELRAAFPDKFESCFFELYLHELLLRLGCEIEIHPEMKSTARRPDFLVRQPDGTRFILEAVLATGKSRKELATEARTNEVYDALDRMHSPNFFVGMRTLGAPLTPPPARKMREFLERNLAELDPDDVSFQEAQEDFDSLPHWLFEHDGWRIDFFPVPKKREARGKEGVRPLGAFLPMEMEWLDPQTPIREVIKDKATRYGKLELPFIVAVNALEDFARREHIMDALFGREQWVFYRNDPKAHFQRKLDGIWTSPSGPIHTRLSGVLTAIRLRPQSVSEKGLCLYHNPWAQLPYQGVLDRLPRAIPDMDDHCIKFVDGIPPRELFGLPTGWPELEGDLE